MSKINFLELLAACIPILIRAPALKGHQLLVLSDNTQTVAFINRGTTKNLRALRWLKRMFECCLNFDIRINAVYSLRAINVQADALSWLTEGPIHGKRFFASFYSVFPGPISPGFDALQLSAFKKLNIKRSLWQQVR